MTDPVASLVRIGVLAPGLRLDQSFRARDGLELPVLENFSDQHRLVRMMVAGVHHDFSARRQDFLTIHSLADGINIGLHGLFHRLLTDQAARWPTSAVVSIPRNSSSATLKAIMGASSARRPWLANSL